jgi:hypothetical protein
MYVCRSVCTCLCVRVYIGGGSPTIVTCGSETPDEIFFSTLQDTIESPGFKAATTPTSPSTSMLDTLIPEDSILKGGASFDT